MTNENPQAISESTKEARRKFIKFLAASPAIASLGGVAAFLANSGIEAQEPFPPAPTSAGDSDVITDPAQALDVFDFEEPAHRRVSQGHWTYMASGVDADATLRANREGFTHVGLRPRRLVDTSKLDMKVTLFGTQYSCPIFTCPTAVQKGFHPDGEAGVGRATKNHGMLQMLSTQTGTSVEEVNQAHGQPVWYQLYAPNIWEACHKLLDRVAAAGCPAVVLTVDVAGGRNSETFLRLRPANTKELCVGCHHGDAGPAPADLPMLANLADIKGERLPLDWKFFDMIRTTWKGKLLVKGLETPEDARLAIDHGVDAVYVSNHGGRGTETNVATIQELPAMVAAVRGRVPIFIDSGFRRGTDIFKALAMGATAVGIGRPVLWGLGAFGAAGVDKVCEIVQHELRITMSSCGATTIKDITPDKISVPDSWKA
jgi:4-hydroxymandelate oxidase